MEKNIEGGEYLDYLAKTLERWRNYRAVSLGHRSLMIRQQYEATMTTEEEFDEEFDEEFGWRRIW